MNSPYHHIMFDWLRMLATILGIIKWIPLSLCQLAMAHHVATQATT